MSTAVAQQRSKLKSGPSTSALLDELEDAVEQIIRAVAEFEHPERAPVDDAWTVKDTLGHIAFWHDSFARNVAALTDGRKPNVLKGTYPDLNARGITESRGQTAAQIAERIRAAQRVLQRRIPTLPPDMRIPYRIGSRDYAPDEHLAMVRAHILAHLHRIERARRRRVPRA